MNQNDAIEPRLSAKTAPEVCNPAVGLFTTKHTKNTKGGPGIVNR